MDGVVVKRLVNIGQTVVSSMSASSLFYIATDLSKLDVYKRQVIAHAPSIATQEYGNPDQLIEAIAQFVNMLRLNHPEVPAIGMGMPGFVNFYQGTVYTVSYTHL